MDPFDECSVLLPSATLDDFPTGGSDTDARSLLAGWTVLWHPQLLARTEQLPTWYRADVAPTPDGPRVVVVPDSSQGMVPAEYRRKCDANPNCIWVAGADRAEMLSVLAIDSQASDLQPLQHESRTIGVEDFYAAGYLSLQIQIMTRRLRYTSNLDELHLQSRIVAAAKAFCDRDAAGTAEALHDVFDCLSEERDHYFTSDPHLVDLTLLTPKVLRDSIESGWLDRFNELARCENESAGILGTPLNVLLDGDVASAIVNDASEKGDASILAPFVEALGKDSVGWAGGGSASDPESESNCLDAMTMAHAMSSFREGSVLAEQATKQPPVVYARLSGSTPVDLIPSLTAIGYRGVIPMDFSGGTGYGEESKLLIRSGNIEIEALTAKPIDASSDAAYLSIGAHMGEAIDGGEVATALLVHWPDKVCDSHRDLLRAASWSLAMGRFWRIDQYFTEGERPYHSGHLNAVSPEAADAIVHQITTASSPNEQLANLAKSFVNSVRDEAAQVTQSIAELVRPALVDQDQRQSPVEKIATAIGENATGTDEPTEDLVCFNPHGAATRCQVQLGGAPDDADYIYGNSAARSIRNIKNACDSTIDVPAFGFTRLRGGNAIKGAGLLKRFTGKAKDIAETAVLKNEFMAVSISEESGGVSGVYSASRGNRMSMRLNVGETLAGGRDGGQMLCREMKTVESGPAKGVIRCRGDLCRADGKPIAGFELQYTMHRGSRFLHLDGTIQPREPFPDAEGLFKRAFSVRTAVAGEASVLRALVRDKLHSTSSRRLVSPLGVLIDEAEKQTLVCGYGLPLHRKVGDRFLDTVIGVASADQKPFSFQLAYGFDCPNTIAAARSLIAPPFSIPLNGSSNGKTHQAWLLHTGSPDVHVTQMQTARRSDGRLACRMTLVQTKAKTAKAKLQFATHPHAAFHADPSGIERVLDELPETVRCEDGTVSLQLTPHEAADLIVVFDQ
ncbi:hypothetical protein [Rhodopirellula sp. MGV]|uniref:hypothetical protein n=1 Tax=Rhodopirellula sp. MGV TaxID=2023130 RepID=UPI000B965279|nr:hypothetical protein [Rhodopirellula sp. MGV]OYP33136.1 hypothetical protein CGZ80_18095 [Rhodopirellula sp. MGV]PNY35134.1 hypothetical protein C2E31_19720 [Rhodopirellula baltica]